MNKDQITIAAVILAGTTAIFAYKWWDDRKDIKEFSDTLSKLPAGTTQIPVASIPQSLLAKMNDMK